MINIKDNVLKVQNNFWNNCLFHPTDAIEDSWGKRILDKMAEDKSARTIRIYNMLEDIVYFDMDGELKFDFRANDLRIEYLLEKGFEPLIAFAAMPDCIAADTTTKTNVSFKKTRYKGKLINTSKPKDYTLWEEVCYQYAKHLVEKFGIEQVSKWRMQCFNEPDIPDFFLSSTPHEDIDTRIKEYCKLYEAFANGIGRASKDIKIGGPALALSIEKFLKEWLLYVKENNIKLDFVSYHNYGCLGFIYAAELGVNALNVERHFEKHQRMVDMLNECGFKDIPIVIDEWGAVGGGFKNITQIPELIFRENEVFSAYFAKLIYRYINSDYRVEKLMICLSGQHEMEEEFTGFRGFFTLNNMAKPIYSAHALAAKLKPNILECSCDNENVYTIPTRDEKGNYAVMLSYSSDDFEENLPTINEKITFNEDLKNKTVSVYCIDKNTTNPYRMWEKMGCPEINEDVLKILRKEAKLKPVVVDNVSKELEIELSPNAVYLITVEV